jgi:predicted AAA+ superfamily ATPase
MPLSFSEFIEYRGGNNKNREDVFNEYLLHGGFPGLIDIEKNSNTADDYLSGILNTIIVKDIATIGKIRDVDMLRKTIDFVAANIGSYITASKISGYLVSTGRKSTADTIDSYLRLLENAFIFYRAGRYNVKGKNFMKTNNKFYIVDLGMRGALTGHAGQDYGSSLENIVYLELLRRGYSVTVGKYEDLEIDFVAKTPRNQIYIQVSATILDEKARTHELKPLQLVSDNYPKFLLSMDKLPANDFNGIRHRNIIDFLLSDRDL